MDGSSTSPQAAGTSAEGIHAPRSTSSSPAPSSSLQQLSLNPPNVSAEDVQATITAPVPKRPRPDAFSNYRDGPPSNNRRSPPPVPAAPAVQPRHYDAVPYLQGIQPHPAHSPRWKETPPDYTNRFSHLHPWASYIDPRPSFIDLSEDVVTAEAPGHVYRQIPSTGYFGSRFIRSLFPRRFIGTPSPTNRVPLLEAMQIQDIIAFRQHAVRLMTELLDHRFRDDSDELQTLPRTPPGAPATRNYGQGVILEAKDFFIPGPDHRELQCLPMTQESVNYITRTRGFDKHLLSVKDFVWVLSLRPTHKTLNTWDRETVLRRSRIPRSSVLDSGYPYLIVLAVNRRGPNAEVNNIHAAFEGSREAVRVTQSICDFPLDQAEREDLLLADVRPNVSCAMRFSHTAISVTALQYLTNAVRRFLPAHPDEAILPLRIEKCRPESMEWVQERLGSFTSYVEQPRLARRRMAQLFAMASAALAAQATLAEDRSTHHVAATIPSLDSVPLRLFFELPAMTVEGGWSRGRQADIWIVDSNVVLRTRVAGARFAMADQVIRVELHSIPRTHDVLRNTARRYGAVAEGRADFKLPICVRIARVPTGTDPVFEFLAQDDLVTSPRPAEQTLAHAILDAVYASAPRPPSSTQSSPAPVAPPLAVRYRSRTIHFREDQARAVQRGTGNSPLLAIQAAFGTGKTLVGATIAARVSTPGQLVVATATTNVAVARFAESLLGLEEYRHRITVLRFVADTALQEGTPTTQVDLHNILKDLLVTHSDTLQPDEQERLERYARGRRLIERVLFNPEATSSMTDEEREEYRIAENQNSRATERAVKIMFRVRNPTILCITVSSLLNTTNPGGIFHESLFGCRTIIADEASQVPEPAFVALTAHFPTARQIYIGDVYQLQPHTRSSRSSLAARLGGKGVMDLLMAKDVPLAPLTTTFRAHPALNELPNTLVYGGTLSSGTSARHRTMLTERLALPNSSLPLVVVNVEGHSRMSHTQSHSNEDEANCCIELVRALLAKNISPGSTAIITFYKDQTRLLENQAARLGVRLHTVDSVQGHEMDIVIILTTRTHLDRASGEFLDDIRRMNVAMTRCRHGQFILGHVDALRSLTNWARLLRWAAARNVVIERSALPDLFS